MVGQGWRLAVLEQVWQEGAGTLSGTGHWRGLEYCLEVWQLVRSALKQRI